MPHNPSGSVFQSTLPRGERRSLASALLVAIIFQSTLPRGERRYWSGSCVKHGRFQSTLPRGERLCTSFTKPLSSAISIHAPARGATGIPFICIGYQRHFNPRSREGSDKDIVNAIIKIINFNPRSREGSDSFLLASHHQACISIHAPARGATDLHFFLRHNFRISIHAPARGATYNNSRRGQREHFNPRSREGSDCIY